MALVRPIHWIPSLVDLIWPVDPFKKLVGRSSL
jgi:hypothetical protein